MTRRTLAILQIIICSFIVVCAPGLCSSEDTTPQSKEKSPQDNGKSFKDWLQERWEAQEHAHGFSPQIGTIATGSGFAGGIRYSNRYLETSALLSLRGYQQYELKFGIRPPRGGLFIKSLRPSDVFQFGGIEPEEPGFFAFVHGRYRNFPQEDFFGIGNETVPQRTDFKLQEASYYGISGYQIEDRLRFDVRVGYLQPELGSGSDENFPNTHDFYTDESAPGLLEVSDFLHFKTSLVVDYRDQPHNSKAGAAVGIMFNRYVDLDDNGFDFTRFAVDGRFFRPVHTEQHLVAIRLLTSIDVPSNDSRVPFYLMETLGGGYTLRGYTDYRFRDNKQLHVTFEYRWELKSFVEAAAFYDTGKVFHDISEWNFNELKNSYGVGLRFKTSKKVFLRFDLARSSEETRFMMKFGPAF